MPISQITPASISALGYGFKNRIINGDMRIDQRNAGGSVTPVHDAYTLDRYKWALSQASKLTSQQSSVAPAGFVNSMLCTSSAATTVGSSDYFFFRQSIEGLNVADLGWGTANAQTVTLSFWVRASLTGQFGGSLRNNDGSRSYPFAYTINAANTWEYKTITIPGETNGTWLTNNSNGIQLGFSLGSGSTFNATAGTWAAGQYFSSPGSTNLVGTNGATFYITGVQLEAGSVATSFDYRPYGAELALCQRYYQQSYTQGVVAGANTYLGTVGWAGNQSSTSTGEVWSPSITFRSVMRTAPTITLYDITGNINKTTRLVAGVSTTHNSSGVTNGIGDAYFAAVSVSGAAAGMIGFHYTASAEL